MSASKIIQYNVLILNTSKNSKRHNKKSNRQNIKSKRHNKKPTATLRNYHIYLQLMTIHVFSWRLCLQAYSPDRPHPIKIANLFEKLFLSNIMPVQIIFCLIFILSIYISFFSTDIFLLWKKNPRVGNQSPRWSGRFVLTGSAPLRVIDYPCVWGHPCRSPIILWLTQHRAATL